MTKIWQTGKTIGTASPALGVSNNRTICWCEDDTTYAKIYLREAGGVNYFCYAYGNDNSWTEEILVRDDAATGRLGIQAPVDGFCLDVDQTGGANDQVHIAWSTGGVIYHSELVVPTAPNVNGNWTAWGGFRYQRVDNNSSMMGYYSPHITVDAAGDPHFLYGSSAAFEEVCYNYGNGANHAVTPANELILATGMNHVVNPVIIAAIEAGRDLYAFWQSTTAVSYRYCPNANNPLLIGSWTAAAQVLGFATQIISFQVAYWYDLGGPLCQMMVIGLDTPGWGAVGIKTNWYDEGNVNGWGGGWRAAPNGTTETRSGTMVQLTQVDANDFALTYDTAGVVQFAFTNYVASTFDFIGRPTHEASNSTPVEIAVEVKGRENDNFSFGLQHVQALNLMFDLVRVNNTPTTSNYNPDYGIRVDEEAIITLDYNFTDPGQLQTKRRVQVQEYDGDWSVIEYDSGEQAGVATDWDIPASTLTFNTHYEWRVKVWDNELGDEYDPYSESDWGE